MIRLCLLTLLACSVSAAQKSDLRTSLVSDAVVFAEEGGTLALEAEHFSRQTFAEKRAWYVTSSETVPDVRPDGDPSHVAGASGGAYVEALPDTRRTHGDRLVTGENFSNLPGRLAVLHYKVHFSQPGRYYVWARTWSTGSEDNGLHFGLDGTWPASGQRWQTVRKNGWSWECRQRTEKVHTGVPFELYLDIPTAGPHELMMCMREDGAEVDKIVLTRKREGSRPQGVGPTPKLHSGQAPRPFPQVKAAATSAGQNRFRPLPHVFPPHWGPLPAIQTRDIRPLPGGYGQGSSTLAAWIAEHLAADAAPLVQPRGADGDGRITIEGELKQWHKVTLTLHGPYAHERDNSPNPFTDVRFSVTFTHESGSPKYTVPGYFAADGDAANTGAKAGTAWRAHLSPDKTGRWDYQVALHRGSQAAVDGDGQAVADEKYRASGAFHVGPGDKAAPDFRAQGRLEYVGGHYLRFAGSGEYFLKAGPDAPETLLAYADFDDTVAPKGKAPLKTWAPHVGDWREGDPTWSGQRGRGLIGALNYLADKGCNSFSFLPYNAGGDGDNVWPFVSRNDKLHYDCSKLDQWQIVFDHATSRGLHLHFKLQENEIDDNRLGKEARGARIHEALDGGQLGPERRLYCRELVARFGYELGLLWNLGEENTQSPEEQRAMIDWLREIDPWRHNIVVHTFPDQQDKVYTPLLGKKSGLTGASLQNSWHVAHERTLKWRQASAAAGRPWVVCNDEQNPAALGVPPDPGYAGHDGVAKAHNRTYTLHDIRKRCLWGTLMAGGGGVEYYFGYQLPQNDLVCEDFRSRDASWDYCRIALNFFREHKIPFHLMENADALVGDAAGSDGRYCFAQAGRLYLVYLPAGGNCTLDLSEVPERVYQVRWFNPRTGGPLAKGSVTSVSGGEQVSLGQPPADVGEDWVVLVR